MKIAEVKGGSETSLLPFTDLLYVTLSPSPGQASSNSRPSPSSATGRTRIVAALESEELGYMAKVSTTRPSQYATSIQEEVVCIYTYDGNDVDDVWRVREALRRRGFTQKLGWKSDQATHEGRYESLGHVDVYRYEG